MVVAKLGEALVQPHHRVFSDAPARTQTRKGRLVFLTAVVNLTAALFGYDLGATTWVLVQIESGSTSIDTDVLSDDALRGFLVALMTLGAALGAMASFWRSTGLDPRDELRVAAAFGLVGGLGEGLTAVHSWTTLWYLAWFCGARLLYGVGVGIAMHTVPSYLAEVSPPALRGRVGSCEEIAIVLALAAGYIIGAVLPDAFLGYFVAAGLAGLALPLLALLPRSPRHLLLRNGALFTPPASLHTAAAMLGGAAAAPFPAEAASTMFSGADGGTKGSGGRGAANEGETDGGRAAALTALRYLDAAATEADVEALVEELREEQYGRRGTFSGPASGSFGGSGGGYGEFESFALPEIPRQITAGTDYSTENDGGDGFVREAATAARPTAPMRSGSDDDVGENGGGEEGAGGRASALGVGSLLVLPSSEHQKQQTYFGASVGGDDGSRLSVLRDPTARQPLQIALGLMVLQQCCGMSALLYYAGTVLGDIGVDVAVNLAFIGVLKLSCAVAVAFLVDRVGRRTLLLSSVWGMLASTVLLAAGCFAGLNSGGAGQAAALAGFYLMVATYELGIGPVAWVLLGEMFSASHRRKAVSLAILVNFFAAFAMTMALPSLKAMLGYGSLFSAFAVICAVGVAFVSARVVETSRMSLAQVQAALLAAEMIRER